MRSLGPAIKVGITATMAFVAGYWAFQMLAKGSCAGEQVYVTLHAYFRDATLLVEKSGVEIAGVNVGYIVSRELNVKPPRESLRRQKRFAKITIALNKNVGLFSNAVIHKRSASLLGQFYLEIDPGQEESIDAKGGRQINQRLKDGDEILRVGEITTISGVVQQASEMMPILKDIAANVRDFTRGDLKKISTNLKSIGENINGAVVENRQTVKSLLTNLEKVSVDLKSITGGANKDVSRILADVKQITGTVKKLVQDDSYGGSIKNTINKLSQSVDKLDKALAKANDIAGDVKGITGDLQAGKGSVGRLLKDDTLIKNVERTVEDVGGLVGSLASLQTVVGLRSEYNFQAGTIKTYISIELRPRPDKYYLIELINDPRGRRDVSSTIIRSDDPSKPALVREDKVVLSDAFRVTFQFAKRIGFAVARFGVKESSGGIGLDLKFFNDRLQLWTDLFDFQANVFPRLKVLASWEFFKRLYVVAGIDDAFNERPQDGIGGGRDFFVGAQLRFNDEDLRSLLLVGGSALTGATQ